jgi:hypothetical protein
MTAARAKPVKGGHRRRLLRRHRLRQTRQTPPPPNTCGVRPNASTASPSFATTALADGIKQLLFSSQRGPSPPVLRPREQFLLLPFGWRD